MEEQTNQEPNLPAGGTEQPQQPTPSASGQQSGADPKDVQDNKAITFLSYIGILFLIPLLAKKESKFAQFHAKQGLVLVIVEVAGMFLSFIGIGVLISLAAFIFSIMGIINVANGKMKKLPIVGDLSEKFNI